MNDQSKSNAPLCPDEETTPRLTITKAVLLPIPETGEPGMILGEISWEAE